MQLSGGALTAAAGAPTLAYEDAMSARDGMPRLMTMLRAYGIALVTGSPQTMEGTVRVKWCGAHLSVVTVGVCGWRQSATAHAAISPLSIPRRKKYTAHARTDGDAAGLRHCPRDRLAADNGGHGKC
jgi:hypothetical protein